jgi:hypothetical protein
MLTNHQVSIAIIFVVTILACAVFFTPSSIYGAANATTAISEQHVMGNHVNSNNNSNTGSTFPLGSGSSQVSPYTEQEMRNIKSLSHSDIQSLQNGTGEAFGGMAKPAELNSYPGPRHVLDMALELQLTDRQRMEIERIYRNMSSDAKSIGETIIAVEQQMDREFANKTITQENLKLLLDKSADLYGQLRFVHLSAHLDTVQVLATEQIQLYNQIRGYDNGTSDKSSSHNQH